MSPLRGSRHPPTVAVKGTEGPYPPLPRGGMLHVFTLSSTLAAFFPPLLVSLGVLLLRPLGPGSQ